MEAFGPLEFITPYETNSHLVAQRTTPFNSEPQSRDESAFMRGGSASASIMDGGDEDSEQVRPQRPMWAVKWEHRNDAVSAITASMNLLTLPPFYSPKCRVYPADPHVR